MLSARVTAYYNFSCYQLRRTSLNVMLTLVDKALLVKLFYHSQESPIEALRRFRAQKGTHPGLLSILQRVQETGSQCNRSRSGAPRSSERRTSAVASQMDIQIEKSTSEVSSTRKVQRISGIPKTSIFRIRYGCIKHVPLRVVITSTDLIKGYS